jgi:HAD superfamily hydrolase (TIGR01509 family)
MAIIKALLYDLDGVLVDATEWHYEAFNSALKEVAGFTISRMEHLTTFNGIPTTKKLEILVKQGRLSSNHFKEIWERKQEKTNGIIKKFASVDETKVRLHEGTKSYKKVCVTNSVRQTALLMLEKTGQLSYLDKIISNEDVNKPKPDPSGYLEALSILNIQADECMAIEDSEKGIEAAMKAGVKVYAVRGYYEVTLENILNKINYFRNS